MKIYTYKGKKNLCGDRIRIERLKKRMTQMELAAKIQLQGITLERDSISRIEIMSKADLIAMLVSIREVARTNGEIHTVEHIDKILEEIRK